MSKYKYRAMDADDKWYVYEEKPEFSENGDWWTNVGCTDYSSVAYKPIGDIVYWKDSLVYCKSGFDKINGIALGEVSNLYESSETTDDFTTVLTNFEKSVAEIQSKLPKDVVLFIRNTDKCDIDTKGVFYKDIPLHKLTGFIESLTLLNEYKDET